jgi:hypothetical protein
MEPAGDRRSVDPMATIEVSGNHADVRFAPAEKVLGLARDFSFPTEAIESVEVIDDGIEGVRGIRAPGLGIPRVRYAGTWRHREGKDLVSVRRGQPALRITLRGQRYAAVIIGLDDAGAKQTELETT